MECHWDWCEKAAGIDWGAFGNTFIAALLGTAVGGLVAFWIENRKRKQRLEDERVTAINTAIFVLHRVWLACKGYQKRHIDSVRDHPAPWYRLEPARLNRETIAFDTSSLAFLFESDSPALPSEIQTCLTNFGILCRNVTSRAEQHSAEVQPRIERDINRCNPNDAKSLTSVLGPRLAGSMKVITEEIISGVSTLIVAVEEAIEGLRRAAKIRFPPERILKVDLSGAIAPGPNAAGTVGGADPEYPVG